MWKWNRCFDFSFKDFINLPKNSEVIVPAMTWCSTEIAVLKANPNQY